MAGTQYPEQNRYRRLFPLYPDLLNVDPKVYTAENQFWQCPAGKNTEISRTAQTVNLFVAVALLTSPILTQEIFENTRSHSSRNPEGVTLSPNHSRTQLAEVLQVIAYHPPPELLNPVMQFKSNLDNSLDHTLTFVEIAAIKFSDIAYRTRFGNRPSMDQNYFDTPKSLVQKAVEIAGLKDSKVEIAGMHQMFAVLAVREVIHRNFNLEPLFKELCLNIIRDSHGNAFRLNASDLNPEQVIASRLSQTQVNSLLAEFKTEWAKMQNIVNDANDSPDNSSVGTSIQSTIVPDNSSPVQPAETTLNFSAPPPAPVEPGQVITGWSPEIRAQATLEAARNLQIDKSQYELLILSSTMPLTVDQIVIPNGVQGVEVILDSAGQVVGLAINVAVTVSVVPGLLLGTAQSVIEGQYGYTEQQLNDLRLEGWKKIFIKDLSGSSDSTSLTNSDGKTIVRIDPNANTGNKQQFNSDQGGQTASNNPDQWPPNLNHKQEEIDIVFRSNRQVEIDIMRTITELSQQKGVKDATQPKSETITSFATAIYNPKTGQVFAGRWNDNHWTIANKNGFVPGENNYVSLISFKIEGGGNTQILLVDLTNMYPLSTEIIENLNGQGFVLMTSTYNWIVPNRVSPRGFVEIPSAINNP